MARNPTDPSRRDRDAGAGATISGSAGHTQPIYYGKGVPANPLDVLQSQPATAARMSPPSLERNVSSLPSRRRKRSPLPC